MDGAPFPPVNVGKRRSLFGVGPILEKGFVFFNLGNPDYIF